MNQISRLMVAFGSVFASVGLVFLGLGLSFVRPESSEITIGWVLMVGGSVVALLGWIIFRRTEGPDTYRD